MDNVEEFDLNRIKNSMDENDYFQALTDRKAWNDKFAENYGDGFFINTPYIEVLKEEMLTLISKFEATEFITEKNKLMNSINNSLAILEIKIDEYLSKQNGNANKMGIQGLKMEIVYSTAKVKAMLDEYSMFTTEWQCKLKALGEHYNLRIAQYLDLLVKGRTINAFTEKFDVENLDTEISKSIKQLENTQIETLAEIDRLTRKYQKEA